jgi:hypothetical protein
MAASDEDRKKYGHQKYAALHLMFSRLLRHASPPADTYVYVTLGGTELRDVQSLWFIDAALTTKIYSYEQDKELHRLATTTVTALQSQGIPIQLEHGSFFDFKRPDTSSHIFFLDLENICGTWGGYDEKLGQMFQRELMREGDILLITSSLGRDPGIDKIMKAFKGEYSVLNITDKIEARKLYRRSHPAFTLYRGLNEKGLIGELLIRCLGCIKYQDAGRSPMGLYGFVITHGKTEFKQLVNDTLTHYYDMKQFRFCASDF